MRYFLGKTIFKQERLMKMPAKDVKEACPEARICFLFNHSACTAQTFKKNCGGPFGQKPMKATVSGCPHNFSVIGECPKCGKVIVLCMNGSEKTIPYQKRPLQTKGEKIPRLRQPCHFCTPPEGEK